MLNSVTSIANHMGFVVNKVAFEQAFLHIHLSTIDALRPRKATESIRKETKNKLINS